MLQPSLLIAQITDTHLFGTPTAHLLGVQTHASCQAVLHHLTQLPHRPDLLLFTGDLSQDGTVAAYEHLQDMVCPLGIPTYWVPGNHDEAQVMAQVLRRSPISPQKSLHVGGWHLILLDTHVPGCVHGELSAESLAWLEQELSQSPQEPAMLAFHHPPFGVGSAWMNEIGLRNAADFFAVCDRHPRLKLVVFGHIHQEFCYHRNGVDYVATPSTCIQFKPNSEHFALDPVAPGLRLIHLFPSGAWSSNVSRAGYAYQPDFAAAGY